MENLSRKLYSFPFFLKVLELTRHRGISEGYEYSNEDIKSLYRHIKEKRPYLAPLLSHWAIAMAELHITSCLKDDVDFAAISAQMPQALEADKAEAALDNSMVCWNGSGRCPNNDLFESMLCL